jgi:DNA-binding winged helix-turn-helix (wHTH) protein/Tol biopolymer transport system component
LKTLATPANTDRTWRFGVFEVDTRREELRRSGAPIKMREQSFRILVYLLEHPGEIVTREELRQVLWPSDTFVDFDHSLNTAVMKLREALGDSTDAPLYIETIPKRGYRFIAPVTQPPKSPAQTAAPEAITSPVNDDNGLRDQVMVQGDPALGLEEKPRVTPSKGSASSRRMLLTGLAALLVLIAGFLIRWAIGRKGVPDGHVITYPLMEQRVTSNPPEDPIKGAVVSPDGKYVAYADSTGLYLRQMSTGETRPWGLPKGFVAWPGSWFPDGAHLLVLRIEGQEQELDLWKPSLYKLSLMGGDPQKIMDDAAAGSVSPDGSRIAYLPGPKIASELWVMDSDGANARKVVSAGVLDKAGSNGSWIFPPVWSPNGQRIAYIEEHDIGGFSAVEPTASLLTINPNGSGPSEVLNDSRIGQALWWAPDGRILFAYREDPASEKDNFGVYSMHIDERSGKTTGPPQPITQAEGSIGGLSATADGKRLILWRTRESPEVFIAKFDARSHQFKEPRRLTLDENENFATAWTSDSKAALFLSTRNGRWTVFKQGIDETTPEVLVEAPSMYLPRLSPDGSQVLYLSSSKLGDASVLPSLMSKPLAGGPPHLVLKEAGINNYGCARAPSKLCIFSKVVGHDLTYVSFDPEHAAERELLTMTSDLRNWVISPDGSKLAIVLDRHRIRFLSLDTGAAHDVTVKDWPLNAVDWSADGQTVFMPSVTPKEIPVILEVDQAGKARVVLQGVASTGFGAMIQSPDRQYGLLMQLTPAENNAWMVDNF